MVAGSKAGDRHHHAAAREIVRPGVRVRAVALRTPVVLQAESDHLCCSDHLLFAILLATLVLLSALGTAVGRPFGPARRDRSVVRLLAVLLVIVAPLPLWVVAFWVVRAFPAEAPLVRELRAALIAAPYNFRAGFGSFEFAAPLERHFPRGTTREVALRVLQTDNEFACRSTSTPLVCQKRVPRGFVRRIGRSHWGSTKRETSSAAQDVSTASVCEE
jgi:hypothetical protein